jgi:hypothetical protein
MLGTVFLAILSFAGFRLGKYNWLRNKIKSLNEEERILNDLIKLTQQKTFKENIVTIPVPSRTIYESGDGTCTTARDCPDRCGEQTIKMYGNRSHCPLIECSDGKCIYKLVP